MLARFDRQVEKRLALGGADASVREDHRMAEHQRAVFAEKIEMTDPQLRVDMDQQLGDFRAPGIVHTHVEGG